MKENDVMSSVYIDVLAEPHLDMMRVLLITKEFQKNRKQRKVLSIEKISFLNAVIVSNRITASVINHYNPSCEHSEQYSQNEGLSYIERTHFIEALKGDIVRGLVVKLCSYGYLEIEVIESEIYVTTNNDFNVPSDDPLIYKWKRNLNSLRFIMNKSNRELFNCLIGLNYE